MGSGEALGQDFYGVYILTLIPSLLPPAPISSQQGLSNSTQILRATSGEPILRQWEQRHADGWTCKQEGGWGVDRVPTRWCECHTNSTTPQGLERPDRITRSSVLIRLLYPLSTGLSFRPWDHYCAKGHGRQMTLPLINQARIMANKAGSAGEGSMLGKHLWR